MKDTLPQVFSKEIRLPNNTVFYYTQKPYQFFNALGNVADILTEYHFVNVEAGFSSHLYKTSEGNWYDLGEPDFKASNQIIHLLKAAIDAQEIPMQNNA